MLSFEEVVLFYLILLSSCMCPLEFGLKRGELNNIKKLFQITYTFKSYCFIPSLILSFYTSILLFYILIYYLYIVFILLYFELTVCYHFFYLDFTLKMQIY